MMGKRTFGEIQFEQQSLNPSPSPNSTAFKRWKGEAAMTDEVEDDYCNENHIGGNSLENSNSSGIVHHLPNQLTLNHSHSQSHNQNGQNSHSQQQPPSLFSHHHHHNNNNNNNHHHPHGQPSSFHPGAVATGTATASTTTPATTPATHQFARGMNGTNDNSMNHNESGLFTLPTWSTVEARTGGTEGSLLHQGIQKEGSFTTSSSSRSSSSSLSPPPSTSTTPTTPPTTTTSSSPSSTSDQYSQQTAMPSLSSSSSSPPTGSMVKPAISPEVSTTLTAGALPNVNAACSPAYSVERERAETNELESENEAVAEATQLARNGSGLLTQQQTFCDINEENKVVQSIVEHMQHQSTNTKNHAANVNSGNNNGNCDNNNNNNNNNSNNNDNSRRFFPANGNTNGSTNGNGNSIHLKRTRDEFEERTLESQVNLVNHNQDKKAANGQIVAMKNEFQQRLNGASQANEALLRVVENISKDRERLLHENKLLKSGVNSLNSKRETLTKELSETKHALHEAEMRRRQLEHVVALKLNMKTGGCRLDGFQDWPGNNGNNGGNGYGGNGGGGGVF